MAIKCVIDSATIISLTKIDALEILIKLNFLLSCPEEVYRETVEDSFLHGYYEAIKIKKLFDSRVIKIEKVQETTIKGISSVDAKVIYLAAFQNGIVLTNDSTLARKSLSKGLEVFGSPDILTLAKERKLISEREFVTMIKLLVIKKRLSAENAEAYLKGD